MPPSLYAHLSSESLGGVAFLKAFPTQLFIIPLPQLTQAVEYIVHSATIAVITAMLLTVVLLFKPAQEIGTSLLQLLYAAVPKHFDSWLL